MKMTELVRILDSTDEDLLDYLDEDGGLSTDTVERLLEVTGQLLSGAVFLGELEEQWPEWSTLSMAWLLVVGSLDAENVLLAAITQAASSDAGRLMKALETLQEVLQATQVFQTASREQFPWPVALAECVDEGGHLKIEVAQRARALAYELTEGSLLGAVLLRQWPLWPTVLAAFVEHYDIDPLRAALAMSDPLDPARDLSAPLSLLDRRVASTVVFWLDQYCRGRANEPDQAANNAGGVPAPTPSFPRL